ncbi:MAG: patatin-like phospholipase family protein [Legionella sp.]|jgi:predicted acylesterase/phospholipase RssA
MNQIFSQQQLYEFIKKYDPFDQMSKACLLQLAEVLEVVYHPGSSLLIKKGDDLNDLYILMKGRLYYQVTDDVGHITHKGELSEGAIIGEMALLSDSVRSANVYTLRDSIILKLTKKDFLTLSGQFPELLNKIMAYTIKRLTNSMQGMDTNAPHNKSIAVIPITPVENLENILKQLIIKFPLGEKILLITKEEFCKYHKLDENGGIGHDDVVWINQQVENYTFIIYLADESVSNWTRFCIRQADSIAYIADAAYKDPKLSPVEQYLKETQTDFVKRTTLLLLHKTDALPTGTNKWLKPRSVNSHYHIQTFSDLGLSRMMRIFTDKTVSLVLSGGGARGLAHLGLIKLLKERNILIDYIAGTSIGAIFAAGFAMGFTPENSLQLVQEHLIKGAEIDFTFPYIAIAKGKNVSDGIAGLFGDNTHIEDLWLNFFCVSTDLVSQNLEIHDTGLLWEAVRSSMSLPFIYPPVAYGDKLLIDGGILNNIPVDTMREYAYNSTIIASNIVDTSTFKISPYPTFMSGWRLLLNKLMGGKAILPMNLNDMVFRLLTISSLKNTEKMMTLADCSIYLDVDKYGMMDYKQYKEIAELGYQQAKEQLQAQNLEELLKLRST